MKKETKETAAYYFVITGDIIGSSAVKGRRELLLSAMRKTFEEITLEFSAAVEKPFEIYRGDSFQTVIKQPGKALLISILIRAKLRNLAYKNTNGAFYCRLYIPAERLGKRESG